MRFLILLVFFSAELFFFSSAESAEFKPRKIKVLHVMSLKSLLFFVRDQLRTHVRVHGHVKKYQKNIYWNEPFY